MIALVLLNSDAQCDHQESSYDECSRHLQKDLPGRRSRTRSTERSAVAIPPGSDGTDTNRVHEARHALVPRLRRLACLTLHSLSAPALVSRWRH